MAIKIFRCFYGGYTPNYQMLNDRSYKVMPNLGKKLISIVSSNQGLGIVKGSTKKLGQSSTGITVCLFNRNSRSLLWETKSKRDGSYLFRNIAVGMECFIVAFDPNRQYNAVIADMIITVDGRI